MDARVSGQGDGQTEPAAEPMRARQPYTTPRMINLGSVEVITRGPGAGVDDGAGSQPA